MRGKEYPKVLVLSHNSFSERTNMGKTMSSFFSGWDSKKLAQIYILNETPSFLLCNNYFKIDEIEVMKSLISKIKPGQIIRQRTKNKSTTNNAAKKEKPNRKDIVRKFFGEFFYKSNIKYLPFMQTLRNAMWNTGKWKTTKLIKWIEEFDPDILFYASGDFDFSMNMAIEISKNQKIPLLVYFGDEFFFYENYRYSIFGFMNRSRYKRTFNRLFNHLDLYITASDSMLNLYQDFFNKKGYSMMASTIIEQVSDCDNPISITYAGGLTLGRWKSLTDIGSSLDELGYKLDVYSGEKNRKLTDKLRNSKGIIFHGFVNSEELRKINLASTILVHVEDVNENNIKRTMFSMSTKIPDMLGSGVCIFAYGPREVASLKYLDINKVGYVVSDINKLTSAFESLLSNPSLRNEYIKNAQNLAIRKHDFKLNEIKFYNIVNETITNYKIDLLN